MSEYICCCDNKDSVLSKEAEQFLEDKLGEPVVFVFVVGKNGKTLPLRSKVVKSKKIDFDEGSISTTEIRNIMTASLVQYKGSDVCYWGFDGTGEEFTHPH